MNSSLDRGLAAPKTVSSQLIRWGSISLLTASSFSTFALTSAAEESSRSAPAVSEKTTIQSSGSFINRANLRRGSQGRDVSELQAALKLLGFYAGTVDGFYGESTAIAVSRFQSAAGLPTDGIVGPATWNQLFPPTAASAIASSTRPAPNATASSLSTTTNSAAAFPVPQIANSGNANSSRPAVFSATATNTTDNPSSNNSNSDNSGAASTINASEATSSVELPVLRLGMQGPAVSRLQERLQAAGLFQGVVDGDFGPETQMAVQAAQRQYQLEVDGIVGPATWRALLR